MAIIWLQNCKDKIAENLIQLRKLKNKKTTVCFSFFFLFFFFFFLGGGGGRV